MRVVVIGGGVSGLSCGIRLLEARVAAAVEIWTDKVSPHTTSDVAAAVWGPYRIAPQERVARWAAASYKAFEEVAKISAAGVTFRQGLEIIGEPAKQTAHHQRDPSETRFPAPDKSAASPSIPAQPAWAGAVRGFRLARPDELPHDGRAVTGYVFEAPVIEMPIYLPYLRRRFETLGGRIVENRKLQSLNEALREFEIVIDCAGLGARELLGDKEVYPVRGQVVRVPQIGLERFIVYEHAPGGLTYIVPRSQDCVLGGTAEEHVESLEPSPRATQAIIERCAILEPRLRPFLADIPRLTVRAGLRPARSAVRLEEELQPDGKLVVHNYGHGGAGVTVSLGCAAEVVEIVKRRWMKK